MSNFRQNLACLGLILVFKKGIITTLKITKPVVMKSGYRFCVFLKQNCDVACIY